MNAIILDGSTGHENILTTYNNHVKVELEDRGWDVEIIHLWQEHIATCIGCFGCWLKTPGECIIKDKGQEIAGKVARSDLLILSTPITFGGYSYQLKKIMDRLIPNILPFFTSINGEIHHKPRYEDNPNLLAIGYSPQNDPESERIFARLVNHNAINLYCTHYYTIIINDNTNRIQVSKVLESSGVLT